MTAALVSEHTKNSHYQKEEIATAIALSNRNPAKHRIVPIFINEISEPIPYGIQIIQGIIWDTDKDRDAMNVVEQVVKCLRECGETEVGSGIAPRHAVFEGGPLPGQVFAAELLTHPVHLHREGSRIQLTVDRRDVREVVFTNQGKTQLCKKVLSGKAYEQAKKIDSEIHDILRGNDKRPDYIVYLDKFPLRWASGGVLSIVEIRETGKLYTPFFFRDIPPIGWHISLGASENEDELGNPWKYSFREFFEETLVIPGGPKKGESKRKRFGTGIGDLWAPTLTEVNAFANEHISLRNMYDGLGLVDHNDTVAWETEPTVTDIRIIDPSGAEKKHHSMLISVNTTELGIETTLILRYQLKETDYLLDGEMLIGEIPGYPDKKTLVRMPMALISYDYLKEVFGNDNCELVYKRAKLKDEEGNQKDAELPSIKPSRPPGPGEIKIFSWDACRRRELVKVHSGAPDCPSPIERNRHKYWVRNFEEYFLDKNGKPTEKNAYPLFTPPAAKVMIYYFANK
jgi:hypothetical protein